ncbi:hypothetical protein PG996_002393 [Apiospora saccharicola]|uniref:Uncharacterized protein n=1 Tax=Apiospora saccharicola TaxID=335842 RepID=A0ABR1WJF1_9PEZI
MLAVAGFFSVDKLAVEATERLCFAAEALSLHCRCHGKVPASPAGIPCLCSLATCDCEIGKICNNVLVELSKRPQHGGLIEWMRTFSAAIGEMHSLEEPFGYGPRSTTCGLKKQAALDIRSEPAYQSKKFEMPQELKGRWRDYIKRQQRQHQMVPRPAKQLRA